MGLFTNLLSGVTSHQRSRQVLPKPVYTHRDQFQSGHGFTLASGTGTLTDDTADFAIDSQSIKLVTAGDDVVNAIRGNPIGTQFNATDSDYAILLKISDVDHLKSFTFFAGSSISNQLSKNIVSILEGLPNNEWCWVSVPYDMLTVVAGTPVRTAIDFIQFSIEDDGTAITVNINALATMPQKANGTIIFWFDDGNESDYTFAYEYMNKYNFKGICSPVKELIGTTNFMTQSQILQLQDMGWDVVMHGDNDPSWTTLSQADIETQIKSDLDGLAEKGFKALDFMSIPGGAQNQETALAVRNYFSLSRSVRALVGQTQPPAQWQQLNVTVNGSSATTAANITDAIDTAMTGNMLCIVNFHDIVASGETGDEIDYADFKTVMDHCNTNYASQVHTLTSWIKTL